MIRYKNNTLAKVCTLFIAFLSISHLGLAQTKSSETGKISGKVVDAQSGETIIGANVVITGTSQGDATDIDGTYTITGLSPGIYSVSISYVSYSQKTITGVEVKAGKTTKLNATLQPETVGMGEVTVTAEASTNNEAGLLSMQRKSIAVQDGLSSEYLSKTGDSNVASAMKRVTGVTLVNGNDVYVRGLGNRYSNIQLNGAQVPSTSPTQKEAPVDLVGSGLVDNVVIQKTFTPDQSGEFSGGSVQITTREFPESKNITFSYSSSINTVSGLKKTSSYGGSPTDFIGYDNGKRSLPPVIKSTRLVQGPLEGQVATALHRDWGINDSRRALPSQKFNINYANQFNEDRLPIGIVSSLTYKYDRENELAAQLREIQSAAGDGQVIYNSSYRRNRGVENVNLSGLLNVFLKPSKVTKIGFKNIYSNSLDNTTSTIRGDFINYDQSTTRQTILDFDRRAIFSSALEFETYFRNFLNSRLSANANFSNAMRKQPDRRSTHYLRSNTRENAQYGIYFDDGGNTHFFSDQDDKNYTAELDYKVDPLEFLSVKIGGSATYKDRDFSARRLEYQDYGFDNPYPSELRTKSPGIALAPDLVVNDQLDLVETTQPRDSYKGEQTLLAGYLSTTWTPINKTTVELGARIEDSDQEVSISDEGQRTTIANVDNLDLLPAVNLTYNVNDKTNLRGAFSITLARPDFREISDFRFQDFLGGEILYGNPDLQRTSINNYDLRFETYPNPGELFAVSVFYKYFENPIEKVYRLTERTEVKYENAKEANLYGLELEGRKNITSQLQLVANASIIYSETHVSEEERFNVANVKRKMYGQSPFSVNVGAYYAIPELNLNLSANYNTFGERIVTVGMKRHPGDEYEQSFHNVSLKADYQMGNVSLNAGVENLLNQDMIYEQGNVTTYKYSPGMTFDFGIKWSI